MLALILAATISAANIKSHIDFLASDVLEGRETGSHGFDVAAQYMASQFESLGLEPSLQWIDFTTAQVDETQSSFVLSGAATPSSPRRPGGRRPTEQHLRVRKDIIFSPSFSKSRVDVDAPIVFAGFGAEEDYANVDARGKIVLVLSGAEPQLPNDERAYFSDRDVKIKTAEAHGAVGLLNLNTNTDEKRRPFAKAAAQSAMKSMHLKDDAADTAIRASINRDAAAAMLGGAAKLQSILDDADKGLAHSFALKTHAKIHIVTKLGSARSANVVARLKGATDENVILSAHLDHLGLAPKGNDRVYNGALDNASGSAALIEIARAFAALPQRPMRSIVFLAVTGEEKGELGSEYFAKHPTVTPIVADINMDMFTMLFPNKDVIALGAEHSTLGDAAINAAKDAGFEVSPDPQPEEVRFIRSDQYSFVKQGVPSITFKAGVKSSDPSIDGEKTTRAWLRETYHTVNDNPDQKLDYASGARWADANFRLALAVANAPEKPAWKKGDFFATKFSR